MTHASPQSPIPAAKALPATWRLTKLEQVCTPVRGVTFPSGEAAGAAFPGSIACLTTSGVQDQVAWGSRRYIPKNRIAGDQQMFRAGDLLVSTANSKALVGKSCLIRDVPFPCTFGAFVTVLRPNDNILPDFLAAWMRSPKALAYCYETSSNTTNISNLRVSNLLCLEMPLPPLPEQKRIVTILTEQMAAAEKVRSAAEAQLEAAGSLPNSFYRAAFKGITPLDVREAPRRAPPGWKWHKLTDLARLESGHTPSRNHPEWWGGDVPWIGLSDIRALDGITALETKEYTNRLGLENSSARLLPVNTVALCRTASVGMVTIMGRPMATSQHFANWVCTAQLNPTFLLHLFQASRARLHELASGSTIQDIYMNTIREFRVCVPDLREQRRLSTHFSDHRRSTDRLSMSLQATLAEAEQLPTTLLRRVFLGEI